MKRNERDELKKLSPTELLAKADSLRREHFSARLQMATRPLKDKTALWKLRKDIARVLTYLRQQRELA